jgi:hypothetical protein
VAVRGASAAGGRVVAFAVVGFAVVGFTVAVIVAGTLGRPRPTAVNTDQLGPAPGMAVSEYLAAAQASVSRARSDATPRWALVSPRTEITPAVAAGIAADARVSRVLYRVPIARVQTPLVTIDIPAGRAAVLDSSQYAASRLLGQPSADDRTDRIAAISAARIRSGCACVVGLSVYGTVAQLRVIAARADVRAVEALPADAVAGHFGVTPLLPEQDDRALPGPDDGPVPDS